MPCRLSYNFLGQVMQITVRYRCPQSLLPLPNTDYFSRCNFVYRQDSKATSFGAFKLRGHDGTYRAYRNNHADSSNLHIWYLYDGDRNSIDMGSVHCNFSHI